MMDLKAIRAREQKATIGQWKMWDGYRGSDGFHYAPRIGTTEMTVFSAEDSDIEGRKEDFEFVAHARQDIPDLLDALEEAIEFGGHKNKCASRDVNVIKEKFGSRIEYGKCDCGWQAFLTTHGASDGD